MLRNESLRMAHDTHARPLGIDVVRFRRRGLQKEGVTSAFASGTASGPRRRGRTRRSVVTATVTRMDVGMGMAG